jgi:hypothetical protein
MRIAGPRRFSYANIAATLALVFSMSGGALAANHYLITSTKQLSPKVLRKLTGRAGANGAQGPQGKEGIPGKEGKDGGVGRPGVNGEKGELGPSHAYSASGSSSATVALPAGSYVVSGEGQLVDTTGTTPGAGFCKIETPGHPAADERFATVPSDGEEAGGKTLGSMTIANEVTAQLNSAGNITERCSKSSESQATVSVNRVSVTATLVGAIN